MKEKFLNEPNNNVEKIKILKSKQIQEEKGSLKQKKKKKAARNTPRANVSDSRNKSARVHSCAESPPLRP
jgi:hypothetical protein